MSFSMSMDKYTQGMTERVFTVCAYKQLTHPLHLL